MIEEYLKKSEYVSEYFDKDERTSSSDYHFRMFDENRMLSIANGRNIISMKYVSLCANDFILHYAEKSLTYTSNDPKMRESIFIYRNITEEWFFQLSTINDFKSLRFEDIQFVLDLYNTCLGD